jgi:hypothetical protein
MKKIYTFITAILVFVSLMAQTPQSFKYQAVLRDGSGNIKANTSANIGISILQGGASGTVVYSETHGATTNVYGIVNLDLGNGSPTSGSFANIDWSTGLYFIKVTVDGTDMGTSQLLSVPYALYAKTSGTPGLKGDKGDTGEQGFQGGKGDIGEQGIQGIAGIKGDNGNAGDTGAKGDKGDAGEQGIQGLKGDKGDVGEQGLQGLKGDIGEQGNQGAPGIKGDKGDAGSAGAIGDKGDIGEQGLQGLAGIKGDKGDAGTIGAKGDKGDTGEQGIQGFAGIKGDKGDAGTIGTKGDKGDTGEQGIAGIKGDAGVTGAKGDKGDTGAAGTNGADGLTTSVNGVTQVAGAITLTKSNIGLANVDNTTDASKPIGTATQTALNLKANTATTLAGYGITDAVNTTGDQTIAGVKSFNKIVIGTDASNASAVLDVNSNSKGVLMPKLTDSERDAILQPAEGLLIFNVTSKNFNVYKNGNWFEWQASNCVPQPTTSNAGSDQAGLTTSASLSANAPVHGTGSWSIISGTGGNIATANSPTSSFTGIANQTYTLRWTITNSCGTSTDDVVIAYLNFCSNGIKDNEETDIDCGGTACSKCSSGKLCNVNSDCANNACILVLRGMIFNQCDCPGMYMENESKENNFVCVDKCDDSHPFKLLVESRFWCVSDCMYMDQGDGELLCVDECPPNYNLEGNQCIFSSQK